MKDFTFTQQYALIGLNGLTSNYPSNAKKAVMRGIMVATFLEDKFELFETESSLEKNAQVLKSEWDVFSKKIHALKKNEAQMLEEELVTVLKADGVLEEIPDILGCDFNYETSEIELKAYRTDSTVYQSILEAIRAEILEEGPVTAECFGMIWIMRESGCLHEIFSNTEQQSLERRMLALKIENPMYCVLWEAEFRNVFEDVVGKFLKGKSELFKNPYLEGVNLAFSFIERRKAIFIDFVVLGTNVASRRTAIMAYLSEHGHYVEEVTSGSETLLKIDNTYYRIFPSAKRIPRAHAVQGAYIVPVYQ